MLNDTLHFITCCLNNDGIDPLCVSIIFLFSILTSLVPLVLFKKQIKKFFFVKFIGHLYEINFLSYVFNTRS